MGAKKSKVAKFLDEHSRCYFCGGPATTVDHVPSRECFLGRVGPEGYEFPACKECNNSAGRAEQTVALYRHCTDFSEDQRGKPQVRKLLDGLKNNSPTRMPIMNVTVNQKRRAAMRSGITLQPGETFSSLPIIGIKREVHDDFAIFSRRLTCALFYKHIGKVMPQTHMVKTQWMQFAHGKADELIAAITADMPNLTLTARVNTNIGQQFGYRWYAENETETFAFVAQFAKAFFVFGIASRSNEATTDDGWKSHATEILPPFGEKSPSTT